MIKTLSSHLKQYTLPAVLTPMVMILEVVCEMIIPKLMGQIVDEGINKGSMEVIVHTGSIMLITAVIALVFGILGSVLGTNASAGFAKNLRKGMFDNIQTFSFADIDRFSPSSLVTRLTTDITNVQMAFQMLIRMAMRAPSTIIIAMIMSFTISPSLASIYLGAVIFLSIVVFFIVRKASSYFKEVFRRYDDLNESVQENISSIRVVKAYVREEHEISRFHTAAGNIYRMFLKAEKNIVAMMPVMMGTVYICILLISWNGAHLVVSSDLTTGDLMSMLAYCMNILMSLMMITMVFVMITMAEASARRISDVLEARSTLVNPENPVESVPDGSIIFENVDFSYNRDASEPVLKNISLDIKSGECIGIIGGTGSAKSSLVNLISRLYDVSSGRVIVGGHDVREYNLDELHRAVSVVLQKNVLFSGTIYENLRWGNKDATDEECRRACELSCADEFIDRFKGGYNTRVEQGGANFSGGQKQRLCIARALLRNPRILILDDSTSAVDTATDRKIRAAFAQKLPDTTRLIISQRISSIIDCDRIIVMNDGQIDGFGTHEQLLHSNDIYREVYESQSSTTGSGDFDRNE